MLDALVGEQVLELRRRRRDPVDHEGEIEAVGGRALGVVQLAHDTAPHLGVPGHEIGSQGVRRREEAGVERDAVHLDVAAQHLDRAARVELLGHVLHHLDPCRSFAAEAQLQLLPLLLLRLLDEGEQLIGEEPERAVVARWCERAPAVERQVSLDRVLERRLGVDGHASSPPVCPVARV